MNDGDPINPESSEEFRLSASSSEEDIQRAAERLGEPVEEVRRTVDNLRAYEAQYRARYEDCTPTRLNTPRGTVRVKYPPGFPMGAIILRLAPEFAVATSGQLALPVFNVAPCPTSYYQSVPDPVNAGNTLHTSIMAELQPVEYDPGSSTWLFEHVTQHPVVLTGLLLDLHSGAYNVREPHEPYGLLQCGAVRFKIATTNLLPPRAYVTYRTLESFQAEAANHRHETPDRDLEEVDVPINAAGVAQVVFWQSTLLCGIVSLPLGAHIERATVTRYDRTQDAVVSPYVVDLDPLNPLSIQVVGAPAGSTLRVRYGGGLRRTRAVLINVEDASARVVVEEDDKLLALYVFEDDEMRQLELPTPDPDGSYAVAVPGELTSLVAVLTQAYSDPPLDVVVLGAGALSGHVGPSGTLPDPE